MHSVLEIELAERTPCIEKVLERDDVSALKSMLRSAQVTVDDRDEVWNYMCTIIVIAMMLDIFHTVCTLYSFWTHPLTV